MRPNLLYICGTFGVSSGGAELSAYAFLVSLQLEYRISVVTGPYRSECGPQQQWNSSIMMYRASQSDRREVCERIVQKVRPDVILTQMLWSDIAMELGEKYQVPTILRVCKVPFGLQYLKKHPPTAVIAVSQFVADYLATECNTESVIIPPLLDLEQVKAKDALRYRARYITIFNPVKQKGGILFRVLAERSPGREFGWVSGWDVLRVNGAFDAGLCRSLCESLSIAFTGGIPADVDFSGLPNVSKLECAFPPTSIYECSRLILLPSFWAEAFGRVAIEAMVNRIPVVGSDVGGLGALMRGGGIVLPKDDPDAWLKAIHFLDDRNIYEEIGEKGSRFVKSFYRPKQIIENMRALLSQTCCKRMRKN